MSIEKSKKLISTILAVCLVIAMMSVGVFAEESTLPFEDVQSGKWYYEGVSYVYNNGLMVGTTEKTFSPNETTTRGMIVTILYSLEGKPEVEDNNFSDIKGTEYYTKPVNWAADEGIVSGYGDNVFGPNDPITREQMTAILYKYAKYKGYDSELSGSVDSFKDKVDISQYAVDGMKWAVGHNIVSGTGNNYLEPKGTATRAQVAVMLKAFIENMNYDNYEDDNTTSIADNGSADNSSTTENNEGCVTTKNYKTIFGFAAGHFVNGVQFDPAKYEAKILLANDKLNSLETSSSMVERSGAMIADNGPYFNTSSYSTYSSLVSDGKVIKIDNSYAYNKCYFVIDSQGNASMQYMKILQTATVTRNGDAVKGASGDAAFNEVGKNADMTDDDGSRMVYTKEYGTEAPGEFQEAVICDSNGIIKEIIHDEEGTTVSIPQDDGFVLCEKFRRDKDSESKWETFFDVVKVGDKIELEVTYDGSSVQDIKMAFNCAPVVLKDGEVYGDSTTYAAEGITSTDITKGATQRMCLGIKEDGTVVIISAYASLKSLSYIMKDLGCKDAMNLDGGSSCTLYVNGKARVTNNRQLTCMITFT